YWPPAGAASPEAAMTVCVTCARASAADRNWMHVKTMKMLMKIGPKRGDRYMTRDVLSLPPEDQCRCSSRLVERPYSRQWFDDGPSMSRAGPLSPSIDMDAALKPVVSGRERHMIVIDVEATCTHRRLQ